VGLIYGLDSSGKIPPPDEVWALSQAVGVMADNLPSHLKLPSVFAVGGSWLVSGKLLAAGAFDEVTRLAREAVEIVARVRGHGGRQ